MKKTKFVLIIAAVMIGTLAILEIASWMSGLKSVLFSNSFFSNFDTTVTAEKYYPLLFDNVILFLVALLLPILFASKYTREIPDLSYQLDKKGFPIIAKDHAAQYHAEGKGLLYGGFFALIYAIVDLFVIKKFLLPFCPIHCGIENYVAIIFSLIYFIIGVTLTKKK